MKKRVLSFVLVLMMIVTLFPFSAFAASNKITITKQPVSTTVSVGETAEFEIEAVNSGSSAPSYIWVDADKVDTDNITDFNTFKDALGDAKLGEGSTLKLTGVTEDMDGMTLSCVVYASAMSESFPFITIAFAVSDSVTLNVNAKECEIHSTDTNLVKVEAKEATCAKSGNVEYYYCTVCNRYYSDAEGKESTTLSACTIAKLTTHGNISYLEAKEGTCCEYGNIACWQCDVCGQKFEDEAGTKALTEAEARTDKVASNHTNLVEHPAVAATCCEEGNIQYWYCDGCKDYFSDAEGTKEIHKADIDTDKDKTNHTNLVEYPAKEATCEAAGNIRYWYCDGCDEYYSDPLGHSDIKKSDTVLKQLDHSYVWYAMDVDGVEWHEYRCSECGTIKDTGSHSGGEAGCCEKAVCEVCGLEYGTTDPDNHKNLRREIIKEATLETPGTCNIYCVDCGTLVESNVSYEYKDTCIHSLVYVEEVPAKCEGCTEGDAYGCEAHYECELCGTWFSDENGENEITDPDSLKIEPHSHYITVNNKSIANFTIQEYAYDETGHWKVCKYCGFDYDKLSSYGTHSMIDSTEATCCSGHVCVECGYDDGERNPDNHVGGTEIQGAYEPEGDKPGYTGDEVCLGCGEVIKQGHSYFDKCGDCANHLVPVEGKEVTCTQDGYKACWECTVCGNRYMDEKATVDATDDALIIACTGHDLHPGLDTLQISDVLTLARDMGMYQDLLDIIKSGDYDSIQDITIDQFLDRITIKDIDHCSDDECHWLGCQRCGMSLADMREDLEAQGIIIDEKWYELSEKQEHSGGTATCCDQAVCDICGSSYGELGDHRYDKVVTEATCTEPGSVKYICNGCQDEKTELAETTPALGHNFEKGKCTRCGERVTNPFYDVSNSDIYYTAVMWAYTYDPQVTAGTDDHHFSPTANCTRGQVVTFIWRAAGCPEPEGTCPFVDVSSNSPYYKAIIWAAEQGITNGFDATHFVPSATVTRGQFVTFLWRYYGEPMPATGANPFVDVSESSPFYTAILWAYGQEITLGYDTTHFRPSQTCNRWQVVMFMYRAIGEQKAF